jgi:hypothetical protein
MNELLKELEKQAYVEVTTWERDPPSGYIVEFTVKEFSREKIAELIIKKCIEIAVKAEHEDAPHFAWFEIKKYFEIEE